MPNHSCSLHDGGFFDEMLNSVPDFQKTFCAGEMTKRGALLRGVSHGVGFHGIN